MALLIIAAPIIKPCTSGNKHTRNSFNYQQRRPIMKSDNIIGVKPNERKKPKDEY